MSVATLVRAHFMRTPENTMVTRRDLLHYGTQDAVDSIIRKLIQAGRIVRVACGVYLRPDLINPLPTAAEIAAVRIAAFHRTQSPSARDVAREHALTDQSEAELVYEVDAGTSQFRVHKSSDRGNCVVYLKSRTARKMQLDLSPARKAIKAIWSLGEARCNASVIQRACRHFSREDREEFRRSNRLMPGWLSDSVHLLDKWGWGDGTTPSLP